MRLDQISEEALEKYIEEHLPEEERHNFDSRRTVNEMVATFSKNMEKISKSFNDMKLLLNDEIPNGYLLKDKLEELSMLLKRNINKVYDIGMYSGAVKKNERVDIYKVPISFISKGEHLRIIFPDLLPKRITKETAYQYGYISQRYAPAFLEYFAKGKHILHTKRVAIVYTHIFNNKNKLTDLDNFETKLITDLITGNLLLDDTPEQCMIIMNYKIGDVSHTEVDVIPYYQLGDIINRE